LFLARQSVYVRHHSTNAVLILYLFTVGSSSSGPQLCDCVHVQSTTTRPISVQLPTVVSSRVKTLVFSFFLQKNYKTRKIQILVF